jgi:hypothetical protein
MFSAKFSGPLGVAQMWNTPWDLRRVPTPVLSFFAVKNWENHRGILFVDHDDLAVPLPRDSHVFEALHDKLCPHPPALSPSR